ncbi:MAG: Crp/Fnr family transcriptional regulator [Clostridiales Family XIII bacterium]|jgi:CRP-like cAMP-binding protein|nr:Crp/Fnr family transcriptional regulator [Clostridiales Family XIII bacterium]
MKKNAIINTGNARIFTKFSPKEQEDILAFGNATTQVFSKEETILSEGSRLNNIMLLLEGRVQGVHFHEDGTLDLVELFLAGDLIGLDIVCSPSRRCPFSLCALDECCIVSVDYDALFSEKLDPDAMRKLHENMIHELSLNNLKRLHKIEVLYRKSLRERICVFLRNRAMLVGDRFVEVDMDREQFAQYLGVNRSSLSHELAMMRQDGLIEFRKGSFTILSDEVFR